MYTRMCIYCSRIYKMIQLLEDERLVCLPCRIIEFTQSERFKIYTDFQKNKYSEKIKELYAEMDAPDYIPSDLFEPDDDENDEDSDDFNDFYEGPILQSDSGKQQRLMEFFNSISIDEDYKIAGIPEHELFFWFFIQDFTDDDYEDELPATNIVEV